MSNRVVSNKSLNASLKKKSSYQNLDFDVSAWETIDDVSTPIRNSEKRVPFQDRTLLYKMTIQPRRSFEVVKKKPIERPRSCNIRQQEKIQLTQTKKTLPSNREIKTLNFDNWTPFLLPRKEQSHRGLLKFKIVDVGSNIRLTKTAKQAQTIQPKEEPKAAPFYYTSMFSITEKKRASRIKPRFCEPNHCHRGQVVSFAEFLEDQKNLMHFNRNHRERY